MVHTFGQFYTNGKSFESKLTSMVTYSKFRFLTSCPLDVKTIERPTVEARKIPTNKYASRSLSERHKALPYCAPLPLCSDISWPAERRSLEHWATINTRTQRQRGLNECDSSLTRSPATPRCSAPRTDPAESSAPWTEAPMHCLLQEPRRAAAGRSLGRAALLGLDYPSARSASCWRRHAVGITETSSSWRSTEEGVSRNKHSLSFVKHQRALK